jgi:hypothetical protein
VSRVHFSKIGRVKPVAMPRIIPLEPQTSTSRQKTSMTELNRDIAALNAELEDCFFTGAINL